MGLSVPPGFLPPFSSFPDGDSILVDRILYYNKYNIIISYTTIIAYLGAEVVGGHIYYFYWVFYL